MLVFDEGGGSSSTVSRSNYNLEVLILVEGGKPENPEKNLWNKTRTNSKVNPHMTTGRNRTLATMAGSERSTGAVPAPGRMC